MGSLELRIEVGTPGARLDSGAPGFVIGVNGGVARHSLLLNLAT